MARILITDKVTTKKVTVKIKDPADAKALLKILAKNDVPAMLYGGEEN